MILDSVLRNKTYTTDTRGNGRRCDTICTGQL